MSVNSRYEALAILDLAEPADFEAVKVAYREMVKRYHPDENPNENTRAQYDSVQEAYAFLEAHPLPEQKATYQSHPYTTTRVYGSAGGMRYAESAASRQQERERMVSRERKKKRAEQEKRREKAAKAARKAAYEQDEARHKQEMEAREKEFEDAMKKINAIRAARAFEAILDAYRPHGSGDFQISE